MLIKIMVNELTPHTRNEEFFDNITGENWTEFLKSIETSGVIEPIVCTKDSVIVSGHQRVRACRELGINEIACEIRDYDDEDKVLKDLIETNLRQRGIGNPNPVKMGRCIKALERIYGISHGGDRKSSLNFSNLKTQAFVSIGGQKLMERFYGIGAIKSPTAVNRIQLNMYGRELESKVISCGRHAGGIDAQTGDVIANAIKESFAELVAMAPSKEEFKAIMSFDTDIRDVLKSGHERILMLA